MQGLKTEYTAANLSVEKLDYVEKEREAIEKNIEFLMDLLAILSEHDIKDILTRNFECDRKIIDFYNKWKTEKHLSPEDFLVHEANDFFVKVKNYSRSYGGNNPIHQLTPEVIYHDALHSFAFACHFIKYPIRQHFHQNVALNFLKETIPFVSPEMLPQRGKNAIFIAKTGRVVHGKRRGIIAKPLDFACNFTLNGKTLCVYITHKYTKEQGGSQDHQFGEAKTVIQHASKNKNKDIFFVAILDGPYYQECGEKEKITRFEEVLELAKNENCVVSTINAFPCTLIDILSRWLSENFGSSETEAIMQDLDGCNKLYEEVLS